MERLTKKYIIDEINRVENIISKNVMTLTEFCIENNIDYLNGLELINNISLYRTYKSKYDISDIKYKYFKYSNKYERFRKDILLNYLDDIVTQCYKIKLLDDTFTY